MASCPSGNQPNPATQINLAVSSGSPLIRTGTDYAWGAGSGQRCFVSNTNYLAMLNTNGGGSLPAQYTGNYLNWYFDTTRDPTGCSNDWNSGRKPCTQTRMMIAKTAGISLVNGMPSAMRAGLSTYNNGSGGRLLEAVGNLDSTKRSALTTAVSGLTPSGNTPLAETLSDIGWYFSRGATNLTLHPDTAPSSVSRTNIFNNDGDSRDSSWSNGSDPIQYTCQKSFAVLVTDGRPQGDQNISSYLEDYDGDCPGCSYDKKASQQYESQGSDYLNDVAQALYEMDLRPGLVDPLGVKNNLATYLISFADDQAINDPLMQSTADQGGGEKFVAGNEAQLNAAFSSALASIVQRTASASSASVNSGSISSDTRIYQAKFNSSTWTGQLLSYRVNSDGSLNTTTGWWDARDEMPAANARQIITVNTDGTGVPFRWTGAAFLDSTRQLALGSETMLNYLRGDPSSEGNGPTNDRVRRDADGPNKLGDMISSAPLFVGRPPFRYRDSLESQPYSTFASTTRQNANQGMVYVGANDGMLHGFKAESGEEVFAFIPSPVFAQLPNLASQTYSHEFFVDGSPSMGDVFFSNAWHTVLVGGLNKGGRGIYALDITNPSTLANAEANADDILLWEFTAANDGDLGLTYSQPAIGKLQDGTWVAVFGNGYNSPSGKAVLYIVNISNGNLIAKLDTGTLATPTGVTWDNGLSTPALVDVNGDRKVDLAYAGDLFGNMWKFDLSGTPSIAFSGAPLFSARDSSGNAQPITVRPEVGRGPQGNGTIVLFGTGKYLELADKNATPVAPQSFYGIVDRNSAVASRSNLQSQQISNEFSVDPDGAGPLTSINVRITTQNGLGANSGWYLDLVSPSGYQAEKQVTNPIIRDGKIVFTTLIPNTDPCGAGGRSWLMELDMLSGAALSEAPFDINNDGQFTAADMVLIPSSGGISRHTSGIQWGTAGILQSPGVIEGETGGGVCVQYKYMPDSAGNIQRVNENCGPGGLGRQSWRQLR
ncbi:MAG: PilC/PilY family type IV pilus protein [Steroidobacteraceae bacterium]